MNGMNESCSRPDCGHSKEGHYDWWGTRMGCLAHHCGCDGWVAPGGWERHQEAMALCDRVEKEMIEEARGPSAGSDLKRYLDASAGRWGKWGPKEEPPLSTGDDALDAMTFAMGAGNWSTEAAAKEWDALKKRVLQELELELPSAYKFRVTDAQLDTDGRFTIGVDFALPPRVDDETIVIRLAWEEE